MCGFPGATCPEGFEGWAVGRCKDLFCHYHLYYNCYHQAHLHLNCLLHHHHMKTIAEGYEGCALWAKHKIYSAALTAQRLTTQHKHSTTTQKQQPTKQNNHSKHIQQSENLFSPPSGWARSTITTIMCLLHTHYPGHWALGNPH